MPYESGFSSSYNKDPKKYDTWSTPQWLFDQLNKEFKFKTDVCASKKNTKCKKYFSRRQNGLKQNWKGTCFCNPPYGNREIDRWMEKALESSREGATVVCLVPAATSTKWWHSFAMKGEIRFIKGKVRFVIAGKDGNPAPFHSAIIVFRPNKKCRKEVA